MNESKECTRKTQRNNNTSRNIQKIYFHRGGVHCSVVILHEFDRCSIKNENCCSRKGGSGWKYLTNISVTNETLKTPGL